MIRAGRVTRRDLFARPLPDRVKGSLEIVGEECTGCALCMESCPTGAITYTGQGEEGELHLDVGNCIACGLCVEVCETRILRLLPNSLPPSREREGFRIDRRVRKGVPVRDLSGAEEVAAGAEILSEEEERLTGMLSVPVPVMPGMQEKGGENDSSVDLPEASEVPLEERLRQRIREVLGPSLHIRHLDSGSCNGCDFEMNALTNPIYDIQRFGLDFVASPRHADLIMVTGGVTRHLEEAVRATYEAASEPKMVVAVGTCAIGGGIIGHQYAHHGGVDGILPVTVYVPGCPPRPEAMIEGILMALDRYKERRKKDSSIPSKPHSS